MILTNWYRVDILEMGFEQLSFSFENDYEGEVISTLIRRRANGKTQKAILYIHGFNDYFFQKEMAFEFNKHNFNFYALDLRKYGRSYRSHQKLNNVRSLTEYYEDINFALQQIREEGNKVVLLKGHSTGGLITSVYANDNKESCLFQGLICNSPFYEFNISFLERKIGVPILSLIGKYFPNTLFSNNLSKFYGYSLHQEKYGEWNYNLYWKPHKIPKVNLGFIRAIYQFHKKVQNGLNIRVPILVLHSNTSIFKKKWSNEFFTGDAVLNVKHIKKYANKIQGNKTIIEIENGLHDLTLSKKSVRENVYRKMFDWVEMTL